MVESVSPTAEEDYANEMEKSEDSMTPATAESKNYTSFLFGDGPLHTLLYYGTIHSQWPPMH